MNLSTKQKWTHRRGRQTYAYQRVKGWGGINQEFGINITTLLYIKQITNRAYCVAQRTIFFCIFTNSYVYLIVVILMGLPRWLNGKEPTCQCRRLRFNLWIGRIPWERKWQPTPVFLPGKFSGQRSLLGYSPCSRKRICTT